MGVKLLTSYVKRNEKIFYQKHVNLNGCCLVFDGDALLWSLLRKSQYRHVHGGDYNIMYYSFMSFFKKLKQLRAGVYLVLDGGSNIPLKNETLCGRKVCEIKTVQRLNDGSYPFELPPPLFFKMVFLEVLHDVGVNFVVAHGEADILVAAIANKMNYPVVTNDSDFFLLDIKRGVISLDAVIDAVGQAPRIDPKCPVYHRSFLLSHLNLRAPMIHFLAVLMGNDYSVNRYLNAWRDKTGVIQKKEDHVKEFADYLRPFAEIEDAISSLCDGDQEMESSLKKELNEYDLTVVNNECDQLYHAINHPKTFPEIFQLDSHVTCINELNRFGFVHSDCIDVLCSSSHFIKVQCENINRKTSSCGSEELRVYMYQIVLALRCDRGGGEKVRIQEFKRAGSEYKSSDVFVDIENETLPVHVFRCTLPEKRSALLCLVGFPMELVKEIENEAALLFLLAAYHWTHVSGHELSANHIKALLGSYLICSHGNVGIGHGFGSKEMGAIDLDKDAAHELCNFQSILFYMTQLNTLMGRPLEHQSVRHQLSGSCFHQFFQKLCKGYPLKNLLQKSEMNTFNIYFDIITQNTGDRFVEKPKRVKQQKSQQQEKPVNKTKPSPVKNKPLNRFAALGIDDDDDGDGDDDDNNDSD